MRTTIDTLTAARAEALFTSHLSASIRPTHADVDEAIRAAIRSHGGSRGCAADVGAAFGEYPELAAPRMRWARGVIDELYIAHKHTERTSTCSATRRRSAASR